MAACLGFRLPRNFNFPYAAVGFSDFWQRWHISLSTWLRDYLYIPLGGNRKGFSRTFTNIMITMLLGGLWYDVWKNTIGDIRIMNLWENADHTGNAQDQLVRVPVPGAILLGVLGLGVASLKLRKFV